MTTTDTVPTTTAEPKRAASRPAPTRTLTLLAVLVATLFALFAGAGAASASTTQYQSLYTPDYNGEYVASASQSSYTGTVTVSGTIWVYKKTCAWLYEQGRNYVTGYGSWQYQGTWCGSSSTGWSYGTFKFAVHDYYSDSVALKICNYSGCRSAHVWN
jgi:hypothetical protein